MDGDPGAPVQRSDHSHRLVQGDTARIGAARPREIRRPPRRKSALVERGDNPGRENGFGVFDVRLGIVEIPEDVAASPNEVFVGRIRCRSSLCRGRFEMN